MKNKVSWCCASCVRGLKCMLMWLRVNEHCSFCSREGRTHLRKPKIGLSEACFSTCQVGAFCVFGTRHTGIPFIFWPFLPKNRKIARFRGWCNTTPASGLFSRVPGIPVLKTSSSLLLDPVGNYCLRLSLSRRPWL